MSSIDGRITPRNPNVAKGKPSINPKGAGANSGQKPLNVKKRLKGKWKVHPVDKLVKIANYLEASNPEFSGKIWMRLLDSCEAEEKKARDAGIPAMPVDNNLHVSDEAALEELENDGQSTKAGGQDVSLAKGETQVPPEASTEENLRRDTEL